MAQSHMDRFRNQNLDQVAFEGRISRAKCSGYSTQSEFKTSEGTMERQQKEEDHTTNWDTTFAAGKSQSSSGRIAKHTSVQSHYTKQSASSILASFGLSEDDLEKLSRYPDDQLTPENMPLILRDIQMHKKTHNIPHLSSQSREKETFSNNDARGSMVIDYGHGSKYGYTKGPPDVKVYSSDVPTEESMKGFQAQGATPVSATPSNVPSNTLTAVEPKRQMVFQRSTPTTQPLFPMDTTNKVPGLCLPSAGPPPVQPMMPPVVPPKPQPGVPPIAQQALPPPPVGQPMMPAMNQPPPPFVPEMLGRIQCGSRGNPPPGPIGGRKPFLKETENPIESPFGVVKASWLPVFSQADTQEMERLPTPSMMNDYYAASPRLFPHMCSLCNVECRHLKDWIQHQNATGHTDSCRRLCQQYPDWNPEALSSSKRREDNRKENHTVRRRSASPSPKRSRRSSPGHGRHQTRSRSRSPGRLRAGRPRSRSPRRLPSPRHRSRSPRRSQDSGSWSQRSCSRERGLGRSAKSPATTNTRKSGEPPKVVEKEPAGGISKAIKTAAEPKMPADAKKPKKPKEAKKALESKKATREPKKGVESKAKKMHRPAQVPATSEPVKNKEARKLVKAEVAKRKVKKVALSKERHESDQNHTQRQRSISPSPVQLNCGSSAQARHQTQSRSRSPGNLRAGSSRSKSKKHLPSPRRRSRSPGQSQDSSSRSSSKEKRLGRSSRSPGSSSEARLSPQTKKQHDQLAPPEKCPSNHLDLQDEATRQERPSSEALQGEQPHSNSEHSALTSLAEKSVLQAMSQFQSGAAGGVGTLAEGEIVSMVQLVAAQVVQAVLASKNPLGLQGSGDRALAGPGATPGLSSEPEKMEEKPEALLHSEGVMVASPGPEGITAGPGLQETPCESSQAEKQELLACSGAEMASPGPETRAATLDSVADISESSKAEKQELAPCPAVQPKVVWICGHDVVQLAREHAVTFWKGDQLGLSDKLTIKWLSQKGMQWNELVPMLEKEANAPPDVIVLQLGDNDLFKISEDDLINAIQKDLLWCLERFPGVKILWSVLLPFPGWNGLSKYSMLNSRREKINQFVGSFLELHDGNVIFHPNITPKYLHIYSEDGLSLSEKGLDTWLRHICIGLVRLFLLFPPNIGQNRILQSLEPAC